MLTMSSIDGSRFLLTYAQASAITKQEVYDFMLTFGDPTKLVVALEHHQDGGEHFHVVVVYPHRVRGPMSIFDLKGVHPNIKPIHHGVANVQKATAYLYKEDPSPLEHVSFDASSPINYIKRKADFDAWNHDRIRARSIDLPPTFTISPTISVDLSVKRRHLFIVGPPDIGKTSWWNTYFRSVAVYTRGCAPYPFDSYNLEQVIVYDDVNLDEVTIRELAVVTDTTYNDHTRVPGMTRYRERYMCRLPRLVIVFSNTLPPRTLMNWTGFNARFHVHCLTSLVDFHSVCE